MKKGKKSRKKRRRRRGRRTRGRKKTASKWKSENCSPSLKEKISETCYSNDNLFKMRDLWNLKHSDLKITTNDPKEIWQNLKFYMANTCKRESCWLRQSFMKNNLNKELSSFTFSPKAPELWKKKPNEWLTSIDILNVMKQYENTYKDFEFIGPSPIDYDKHISHGECVWEELCKFNLNNYIKRGIKKIGVVFNTDPHDKEGSHWVALFINIKRAEVYYFDSYGERISKFINRFVREKVVRQGKQLGIDFEFIKNKKRHQYKSSECGMYGLYFIIEMIKDKISFKDFIKRHIKDEEVFALRKKLYNI